MATKSTTQVTPVPKPSAAKRAAKAKAKGVTVKAPRGVTPSFAAHVDEAIANVRAEAATNRVERVKLAKLEHQTLQAWIKDGEKPPRPATPNLDAINAENTPTGRKTKTSQAKTPRVVTATTVTETGRRVPGAFLETVFEALQGMDQPGGVAPSAIDKAINTKNASNALGRLAKAGRVKLVSEKPRRYSVA